MPPHPVRRCRPRRKAGVGWSDHGTPIRGSPNAPGGAGGRTGGMMATPHSGRALGARFPHPPLGADTSSAPHPPTGVRTMARTLKLFARRVARLILLGATSPARATLETEDGRMLPL